MPYRIIAPCQTAKPKQASLGDFDPPGTANVAGVVMPRNCETPGVWDGTHHVRERILQTFNFFFYLPSSGFLKCIFFFFFKNPADFGDLKKITHCL